MLLRMSKDYRVRKGCMEKFALKLVRSTDPLYWSGRRLAKSVYSIAWGTLPRKVDDDYDFAVLICNDKEVKGNLNIKRRTADSLLPSEKYYRHRHWEQQCVVNTNQVAELCSLAVCESLSNRDRIKVFNGLILGSHMLAMHEGILVYVTVQRSNLIHTLIRLMKYPFFPSENQAISDEDIPADKYWSTEPMPQLYYVVHGPTTDSASFRLLNSFVLDGLSIEGIAPLSHPPSAHVLPFGNSDQSSMAA